MFYPAKFEKEESSYIVTFRDIPEAITQGEDLEDAVNMAKDALFSSLEFYFNDWRKVPMPSLALKNEDLITLPPSAWAKVLLLNEMIDQKVTKSQLAQIMGTRKQEVQRIMDLSHNTKIDTLSNALKALGKNLILSLS